MTPYEFYERWQVMSPRAYSSVSPVLFALGLLALTMTTVRQRGRPGFAQVAFSPAFAGAALLATTGAFVLRFIPLGGVAQYGLSLPMPDMDQLLFGPSFDANPFFYSAILPGLVSFAGVRWPTARRAVEGLCLGFAGTLAAAAWHGLPQLSVLTSRWLATGWLGVNALVLCFIARALVAADSSKDV